MPVISQLGRRRERKREKDVIHYWIRRSEITGGSGSGLGLPNSRPRETTPRPEYRVERGYMSEGTHMFTSGLDVSNTQRNPLTQLSAKKKILIELLNTGRARLVGCTLTLRLMSACTVHLALTLPKRHSFPECRQIKRRYKKYRKGEKKEENGKRNCPLAGLNC